MHSIDISYIARELGKATRCGNSWICCCPCHQDYQPSLSLMIDKNTQTLLAFCHAGCSFNEIIKELRKRGLLFKPSTTKQILFKTYVEANQLYTSKDKTIQARNIWDVCKPACSSQVERYLMSRGYTHAIPDTIKYHPSLFHAPSKTRFPAMVSGITIWPKQTICGIHRTYLNHEGTEKAPVSPNKMMLGITKGGAVRLTSPGSHLILAEGIETALSVFEASGMPTWATLSISGLENIIVPPLTITQEITIAADNDEPGIKAAQKLGRRLLRERYKVRIALPPLGMDFNDILRGAI